ncbi:alpha-amylase family glycosyl hydrolase [Psychromarinibacter sp. C21-152]|uniref:Alpha-amylase family glycosyl hydrolase n=1 Tax=Psychromarinibacter sediminicola TaxID=3033385 RepID=A0AAE3T8P5_9RHOB|nr:alpha-amylase family glycosyl hydrolase [Psychromarinibacter sediminicola]MDF0600264.1 alpha-amylase family glycosyl hydrolase [Psychromarinibacter sediminicola]
MTDDSWWRGSVTYQIYPRSFMDADGDGVGDLKGITDRLGHVADLGVDAIWLSPVFPSPMKDMGYDVSDYRGVDPVFGHLSDFDAMVRRAHDLGLKVIIDQVLSHCSDQHPYFEESRQSRDNPRADWFVWADPRPDGAPPNNWQAIFGGIAWEWDSGRRQYYFHNFLKEQPDFNFHNPEVQQYHLDNMRFWLERGVDGFRLDTVNYYFHDARLPDDAADPRRPEEPARRPYDMQYHLHSKNQPENLAFLERMRALCDEYDARTMVGEVGDSHHAIEIMGQYTSGKRLHMAYSFEMLGPNFSPSFFRRRIGEFFEHAPKGWPCWAFSNHDVPRHATRWKKHGADQDALAKLAAAMLLSFEGSVCLYQGEELGQTETELDYHELTDPEGLTFWPELKGRDGCRTPMVWEAAAPNAGFSQANKTWLPVKPPQAARAVDGQTGDDSVLAFYKTMLALRRAEPSLREGRQVFLHSADPVLAYTRGDDIACVFNLSADDVTHELGTSGEVLLAQAASLSGPTVTLGPNGLILLRLSRE